MHELAIAQALIEAATEAAAGACVRRLTRLVCRVGVLRQLDTSVLCEVFEIARDGTLCAGARLEVTKVPMSAHCPACERAFDAMDFDSPCPVCGSDGERLSGGDALELVTIEGEADDDSG